MKIIRFEDLQIWKDSVRLAKEIYQITSTFPKEERFGIVDQMRRASVSVGANIAEGFGRYHQKEKLHFYFISRGSLMELQHFIYVSNELGFIDGSQKDEILERTQLLLYSLLAYGKQLNKIAMHS